MTALKSEGFLDSRAALRGKVAVIVGGGAGIGAAVTLALAEAGVDVAFCDIDEAESSATQQSAEALGVRALAQHADVTVVDELDAFYASVTEWTKHVDIVVNVAGGVRMRDFMDCDRDKNAGDVRRNFGYVVDSVHHAIPLIRRSGRGGSIVNFTTIEAHRGAAGFAVYAGAKAATTNFTRTMAVEFGAERIRLNCIAPDTTYSRGNTVALAPEIRERMAALPDSAMTKGFEMYIPMKEPPGVDALANAVLFLVSDLSAFVSGTTVHVDGGTMAAAGFIDWPEGDGYLPVPLDGTLRKLIA